MDILTGCTGSLAAEVVKCTAKPVIRHVGYLFRFKKTVDDLTKAKTDLQSEKKKVKEAIKQAEKNNESPGEDVNRWLTNVDQLMEEVLALEIKVLVHLRFCNGRCPDWIRQYKFCKEAIKKTNVVQELLKKGNFSKVAHRAPTPGIEIFSSSDFKVFESRNLAFQQIMEALHEDNNEGIGLYGMGGIGKTTLVKEVYKKVKELNIFEHIVMIVVSRTPDVRRIQGEIADSLDLKLEEESDTFRANRICSSIKNVEKILIIVDDVWDSVELKDFGIPSPDDHKGCRILLTTRSEHVCHLMLCHQRMISLNFLLEKESLALMKSIVGDNPDLNDVMRKVVEECKGLPIAISTVGKALKGKTLNEWNVAMYELRRSRLVDIEGVDGEKNAYVCIKWSYDQLKRKTKLCFLLCSLFPEDYNIPIEELTRYAMGLEEDEDFHSLDDARSQVRAAINSLKDSSLLLEGSRKEFVKMHDMVRDIGLWITSKGENEFKLRACTRLEENKNFERATAISLIDYNTKQLPHKLVCPRLNILLLGGIRSSKEIFNTLFEGMNCLKVLKLHDIILSSQSLKLLTNLRTLYFEGCDFSDDLSSLGKLKRLETLSFYRCGMDALPSELGEMANLKMLDLTACYKLERIPPNVIGRLSQLEELIISCSFKHWDVEGTTSEISNANLSELSLLPRLAILSLELHSKQLPKGFVFPDLNRYFISINFTSVFPLQGTNSRTLELKYLNASSMNALKLLFHTVEYILIQCCDQMECIVDTIGGNHTVTFGSMISPNQYEIFSNLTDLEARECPRLISLFSPSLAQSLKKLKRLSLDQCHEMKQIISEEGMILESHGQPICLPKLETLVVENCGKLEYIFPISVARGLQQLERLKLKDLPRLKKVFGQNREREVGDCEIESHHQPPGFPKLKTIEVEVVNCQNLEYIFPISIARDQKICEGPNQYEIFSNLTDLVARGCPRLISLFLPSLAQSLKKLKQLSLEGCDEMKQIISEEGMILESHRQPICLPTLENLSVTKCGELEYIFPISVARGLQQLETLKLRDLPRLKKVFGQNREGEVGDCEIESHHQPTGFPKLKTIQVVNCENLEYIFPISIARDLPQLEILSLGDLPQLKQVFGQNREGEVGDCEIESHHQPTGFPKLKNLCVMNCENLEYIFPISIARDLQQLVSLSLRDLSRLKKVFGQNREEEVGDCEIESHHQPTGFPKLKNLQVTNCENLEYIFPISITRDPKIWERPNQYEIFSNLTVLDAHECPRLISLFSPSLAQSLKKLKQLSLHGCDEMKQIISEEGMILESHRQPICLPTLETLSVTKCGELEYIFPISVARGLQQLKWLFLRDLPRLKKVFGQNREGEVGDCEIESHHQPTGFPKLKTIDVWTCENLEYIFPISIARDLPQLECLELGDLPQLKQVFGHEEGGDDGDGNNSMLSKLRKLRLKNLPELVSLGGGNSSSVWPSLERLTMVNCPKVKLSFFANVEANVPALQKLQNLQILSLHDWNAISFDWIQGLSNLEELEIKNCGGIQEVVNLEGLLTIKGEQQDLLLPRLKKMLLIDLHELRCICKGTTKPINLNILEDLKVIGCKKLTHLFTPALAQSLQKLKFLEIERCDELEHLIVENAEEHVSSKGYLQPSCFPKQNVVKVKVKGCNKLKCLFHVDRWNLVSIFLTLEELEINKCGGLQVVFNFEGFLTKEGEQQDEFFPRLRKMCLVELHELTYIWKGPFQLINLNNLEDLKVIKCKKLTHLFTPALAQSLQKLKFLEIERCNELEHLIVENAEEHVSSKGHLQPSCFPKLNVVKVKVNRCNKLKCLFHVDRWNLVSIFLTLEELKINKCGGLQVVFNFEGFLTKEGEQQDEFFPRLRKMCLVKLHELTYIWKGPIQLINLNNLEDLKVIECKKLTHLFTPALAQSLQKLKFLEIARCDELEHLIVENVEERVSSECHLQPLCFPKLERVNVRYCNKLKSLFPMTIADSLSELQVFLVKKNPQLMEVFTHEGDAGVQKDVTLPQLELMGLKGLPSLVNLCPKNYQFILPKLWKLRVESCKKMRTTFTRTPDRSVLINGEVAQIDEPTGISTISLALTICPANNDITWTDLRDDPTLNTPVFDRKWDVDDELA